MSRPNDDPENASIGGEYAEVPPAADPSDGDPNGR